MSASGGPQVVCLGLATLDAIVRVERLPAPDERLPAVDGVLAGGGPAATAAVTLARLGVSVAFAGWVGDDVTGGLIRDSLAGEGVDVRALGTVRAAASPFTVALVDVHGRRSLVPVAGGPAPDVTGGFAPRLVDAWRGAAWLHVDHVGIRMLGAVREAGIGAPVSFDGGNPVDDLELGAIALYAPTEQALLARYPGRAIGGAMEAALDDGAGTVVVTRGAAGAVGATRRSGRTAWHEVNAPTVDVVSTLGAGDVFHGALLAALVEGRPLGDALRWATTAAALACRGLDGRSAIPDLATLRGALEGERS